MTELQIQGDGGYAHEGILYFMMSHIQNKQPSTANGG